MDKVLSLPITQQLSGNECNIFLDNYNEYLLDNKIKIINPKTKKEIKQKKIINDIYKWCNISKIKKVEKIDERKIYKCLDKYDYTNDEIIKSIKESIYQFYLKGPRSNAKLDVLHSFLNCIIASKLKDLDSNLYNDISIYSHPYKEIKVKGLIYNKDIDIAIKYKTHIIGIVSVKFIMSNYSQNNINYIETMIGESINLKAVKKKRVFWHPIFIFDKIPYYNIYNIITKNEKIKLDKYNKLNNYIINNIDKHILLPDFISITVIKNIINLLHPNDLNNKNELEKKIYIDNLIDELNPIVNNPDIFDFYKNLEAFCLKIINVINNKYVYKTINYDSLTSSKLSTD